MLLLLVVVVVSVRWWRRRREQVVVVDHVIKRVLRRHWLATFCRLVQLNDPLNYLT